LKKSSEGLLRREARLRLEVEEIMKREIAKVAERAWEKRVAGEIIADLSERRKDPYTVSEELLSGLFSS